MIKDELICPVVDLKTEYYDLGLENRNATDDMVTFESAEATKRVGVAEMCIRDRTSPPIFWRMWPAPWECVWK